MVDGQLAYAGTSDLSEQGLREAARRAMDNWVKSMQKAGNLVFVVATAFAAADILVAQGCLREAKKTYQQALELAATQGNQIRAADLLGVNRNTLRKKIRDLDIQVFRGSS